MFNVFSLLLHGHWCVALTSLILLLAAPIELVGRPVLLQAGVAWMVSCNTIIRTQVFCRGKT